MGAWVRLEFRVWVCMNQAGLDKHGLVQMGAGLGISSKTVLQLQIQASENLCPRAPLPASAVRPPAARCQGWVPAPGVHVGEGRWCQVRLG